MHIPAGGPWTCFPVSPAQRHSRTLTCSYGLPSKFHLLSLIFRTPPCTPSQGPPTFPPCVSAGAQLLHSPHGTGMRCPLFLTFRAAHSEVLLPLTLGLRQIFPNYLPVLFYLLPAHAHRLVPLLTPSPRCPQPPQSGHLFHLIALSSVCVL